MQITIAGTLFSYSSKQQLLDIFKKYPNINVGENFNVGNNANIGNGFSAGNDFTAGNDFVAGEGFKAGNDFSAGDNVKIKIKISLCEGYKYDAAVFKNENNGVIYIQLGRFTRTIEEWEVDFWNDNSQFPNDGSKASNDRLAAYKKLLTIAKNVF